MRRKPATDPRTIPTTEPGAGPSFRPAYVVGMARICVCRFERDAEVVVELEAQDIKFDMRCIALGRKGMFSYIAA